MTTLSFKGVVWEVSGRKDGKGIFTHRDCTVSYDKNMGVYQFKQGDILILAHELRTECLHVATDCILEGYANMFVPCWADDVQEIEEIEAEEAA